jgi:hypothetical protein
VAIDVDDLHGGRRRFRAGSRLAAVPPSESHHPGGRKPPTCVSTIQGQPNFRSLGALQHRGDLLERTVEGLLVVHGEQHVAPANPRHGGRAPGLDADHDDKVFDAPDLHPDADVTVLQRCRLMLSRARRDRATIPAADDGPEHPERRQHRRARTSASVPRSMRDHHF